MKINWIDIKYHSLLQDMIEPCWIYNSINSMVLYIRLINVGSIYQTNSTSFKNWCFRISSALILSYGFFLIRFSMKSAKLWLIVYGYVKFTFIFINYYLFYSFHSLFLIGMIEWRFSCYQLVCEYPNTP